MLFLELVGTFDLHFADTAHQFATRLGIFLVVDRLAGQGVREAIEGNREPDRLGTRVQGEHHDAATCLHCINHFLGRFDFGRAAGRVAEREFEINRLQSGFVDLLVLGSLCPHFFGVDGGLQARRDRHAERYHDHELLLVGAVDLAQGRRDDHHAGVAIEAFVVGEADILLVLGFLAVLVLDLLDGLFAQLDPSALGLGISGGGSAGRGSSRRRGSCSRRGSGSCRRLGRSGLLVLCHGRSRDADGENRSQNGPWHNNVCHGIVYLCVTSVGFHSRRKSMPSPS